VMVSEAVWKAVGFWAEVAERVVDVPFEVA